MYAGEGNEDAVIGILGPEVLREHVGKTPVRLGGKSAARQQALRLKDELARAIDSEDYERAAELRDEIRRVEAESATVRDEGRQPPDPKLEG